MNEQEAKKIMLQAVTDILHFSVPYYSASDFQQLTVDLKAKFISTAVAEGGICDYYEIAREIDELTGTVNACIMRTAEPGTVFIYHMTMPGTLTRLRKVFRLMEPLTKYGTICRQDLKRFLMMAGNALNFKPVPPTVPLPPAEIKVPV